MQNQILAGLGLLIGGAIAARLIPAAWAKFTGKAPQIEQGLDKAIEGIPFLSKHTKTQTAAELLFHHLFLLFQVLGSDSIKQMQANGNKLDVGLAFKMKTEVLDALSKLCNAEFFFAVCKELGLVYGDKTGSPNPQIAAASVLAYTGHKVDNMISASLGIAPPVTIVPGLAAMTQPPKADVPPADPRQPPAA